jgi:hypothetical protein
VKADPLFWNDPLKVAADAGTASISTVTANTVAALIAL